MGSGLDEERANGPPKLLVTSRSLFTTHETRRALGRKLPDACIHGSGFQGIYLVEAEGDPFELAEKLYRECRSSIGRATAAVAEVRSELSPIKDAAIRAAIEHVRSEEKFCFRLNKRGPHFLDKDTPALEYEVGGAIWVALRDRDRVEPKVDLSDPDVTIVADVLGPVTVIGVQRKAWAQGATRLEQRLDPPKLGSSEAPQHPSYVRLQRAGLLEQRARPQRSVGMSKQNIHIAKLLPFLTDFNEKHRGQPVTLRLQEERAAPMVQEEGLPLLGLDLDREGPLAPCIQIMLGVEAAAEARHLTHTVPRVSEVVLEVGSDGEDLQLNIESDAGAKAILQLD